jgi:hypothetical protein
VTRQSLLVVCKDDFEKPITYTNVNHKFGFIAVYAGSRFLETVKDSGRFPGASLRKMLMYP